MNISLDTTDNARFRRITGYTGDGADTLLRVLDVCCAKGLRTKINAMMLAVSDKPTPGIAASAIRGKALIIGSAEERIDAIMCFAPQVMESLRNGR